MSDAERAFRRVLVALDASRASLRALESSTRLAARLHAELVGLFVEDVDLLRMAALPFTRIVGPGAAEREVDVATVERWLRGAAGEARAILERAELRRPGACSLRIVRGRIPSDVVGVAETEDLLIVELRALGGSVRAALEATRGSVLLLGGDDEAARALLAAYDPLGGERGGLTALARVAAAVDRVLAVLLPEEIPDGGTLEREVAAALAGGPARFEVVRLPRDGRRIAALARQRPEALLALPRSGELEVAEGVDLPALARLTRCSVLVLR